MDMVVVVVVQLLVVIVPDCRIFLRWGYIWDALCTPLFKVFLFPFLGLCQLRIGVIFYFFYSSSSQLDVVVVSTEQVLFFFLVYLFSFYMFVVISPLYRHMVATFKSLLFTTQLRNNFSSYSAHLSQVDEKKKNKKKNYLMSELIKACRSCICCPVCWPGLSCFFFSTFRWKENVSYINFSLRHMPTKSPTEKVCICVQKLPDWNLTEKVKRQKNEIKMKRKCLVSSDDVILSTTSDPDSSMNNSAT